MLASGFYNCDCMDGMAQFPDKFFELCICDPPYGIDINMNQGRRKGDEIKHARKAWDKSSPTKEYWKELQRVTQNQIIWGANNFSWIPAHNGYIVWDKDITGDVQFSKAELAFNSAANTVSMIKIRAQTGSETYHDKIHPTQKPIALYKWLLTNYAHPGDKILDTHVGSASSLIACHQLGFQYWGFELDADYYNAATERLNRAKAQVDIFEAADMPKPEQLTI